MSSQDSENPLAGGENNQPSVQLNRFPYSEYLCSDYCFGCAYFQQAKGHFGRCVDRGDGRIYDGTRKGSACALWRVKSEWASIPFEVSPTVRIRLVRLVPKNLVEALGSITEHPLPQEVRLRKYFAEERRNDLMECPFCHSKDFIVRDSPCRRKMRGLQARFKCRRCSKSFGADDGAKDMTAPKEVVDFAIGRMVMGLSQNQARNEIRERFGLSFSRPTMSRWVKAFRPDFKMPRYNKGKHLTQEQIKKRTESRRLTAAMTK